MRTRPVPTTSLRFGRGPDGPAIGVIGAGAAGLSAARYLQDRGFGRVTVLEGAAAVGGKCLSFTVDERRHELGAGLHTHAYPHVRALMRDVGLDARISLSTAAVDCEAGTVQLRPSFFRPTLAARLPLRRLATQLWRQRDVRTPGFVGLAAELALPFREWTRRQGLERFATYIEPVVTGFGYGYFDAVPAAYYLKYIYLMRLPACEIPEGFQELWARVARSLDVRTDETVTSVQRGERVHVVTTKARYDFDYLVVATPPEQTVTFLDADAEERDLMGRVQYYAYHALSVRTVGMPRLARINCLVDRQDRASAGKPIFLYKRWADADDLNYYIMGADVVGVAPVISEETVVARVCADVARFGGRVTAVNRYATWNYFPHVAAADFAADFYGRFDRLQGQRRTYYVGELFNFATVENVCAYSEMVVARLAAATAAARPRDEAGHDAARPLGRAS